MEVHDAGIGVIRYLFFVLNCILLTYSYLNGLLERHFVEEIKKNKYQYMITALAMLTIVLVVGIYFAEQQQERLLAVTSEDYIKWVDYQVSAEAMKKACRMDVESYNQEVHLDWITLLAYAAVRGGGDFNNKSAVYIEEIAQKLMDKEITKEEMEEAQLKYPLKRYGQPEDIANLTIYMLSDASAWMTGSAVDITGGALDL